MGIFITNLVDTSLTLKSLTKPKRKEFLTSFILKCNRYLKHLRDTHKNYDYYHGISIPFARAYREEYSST